MNGRLGPQYFELYFSHSCSDLSVGGDIWHWKDQRDTWGNRAFRNTLMFMNEKGAKKNAQVSGASVVTFYIPSTFSLLLLWWHLYHVCLFSKSSWQRSCKHTQSNNHVGRWMTILVFDWSQHGLARHKHFTHAFLYRDLTAMKILLKSKLSYEPVEIKTQSSITILFLLNRPLDS